MEQSTLALITFLFLELMHRQSAEPNNTEVVILQNRPEARRVPFSPAAHCDSGKELCFQPERKLVETF